MYLDFHSIILKNFSDKHDRELLMQISNSIEREIEKQTEDDITVRVSTKTDEEEYDNSVCIDIPAKVMNISRSKKVVRNAIHEFESVSFEELETIDEEEYIGA